MRHSIEPLEHRIAPAAIVAVTANNEILRFDSATPGEATSTAITGLGAFMGETLVGVDFRPATGGLYGFTVDDAGAGHLYLISLATGEATIVGSISSTMTLPLSKTDSYGFDFNPTVDRIRVVTSTGQNIRLNPNNGSLAGEDTDLSGGSSSLVASGYDRSFAGAALTTLFGIDVGTDQLVRQGGVDGAQSPNGGVITAIGALNVNATDASFDIANGTGIAYAALTVSGTPGLYTVDLATGAATSLGTIGNGSGTIVGMSAVPEQIRIVNAKTATYNDVDGDLVTIKITKGTLTEDLFELGSGPDGGAYLRTLNLTDPMFAGTNVTITAKAGANGGDKLAGIGYINATGNDLGTVKIAGDLTQIDAGNAAGGVGVKSLSVTSFGVFNPVTSAGDTISSIEGSLNKLTVKRDFIGAQLDVTDSSTVDALGKIGSVTIGGSLIGGSDTLSGSIGAETIGTVKIGRDLQGGSGGSSGAIITDRTDIKSVTIGGSLIGGGGSSSGFIQSDSDLGSVNIKGSILGGIGFNSARITAEGEVGSIVIGGSLVGSAAESAGRIDIDGTVKSLTIKGSILGGSSESTGVVDADEIVRMTVGGSIVGEGFDTGSIEVIRLGSLKVGGDISASGGSSGRIFASDSIGSVSIGGSVFGDGTNSANIQANNTIGTVSIRGSLAGANEDAGGILGTSIEKVTIGGNLVGSGSDSGFITANEGNLGTVVIKGSIQGGSVQATGDVTSVSVGGDVSSAAGIAIHSDGKLMSVTIKGSLTDTYGSGDIDADEIGKVSIGGSVLRSVISSEDSNTGSVVIGGSLVDSTIDVDGDIGKVTIGADIQGTIEAAGIIAGGKIDSVAIKGSIIGGNNGAGIIAGVLGSISVGKDIRGVSANVADAQQRVIIAARGTNATSGTVDLAIASVTVGGSVINADIAAGYTGALNNGGTNADAQIGKVTVGGDWITSNIVAGTASEDSVYGDSDDSLIPELGQVNTIVASIASITIKGSVDGTFGGTDGFAFTAEEIKAVSIGGVKQKLTAGNGNDNADGLDPKFSLGSTQDVRIREIQVV